MDAEHIQQQIERLRETITRQEALVADLEAEVLDLRRDLDSFTKRYDRVIRPIDMKLEAVKAAISDLEDERDRRIKDLRYGHLQAEEPAWQPPAGYVPVEEQFKRLWESPPPDEDEPPESPVSAKPKPRSDGPSDRESQLKRLYRQLARRYHPDLATDAGEREQRNAVMARINEAYTARDLEALQALARQPEAASAEEPLAALRLQELEQITVQLANRIVALRMERTNLLHSDLMQLKIEARLARSRGRDLLAEMAARLEREYDSALRRMEQLRQHLARLDAD